MSLLLSPAAKGIACVLAALALLVALVLGIKRFSDGQQAAGAAQATAAQAAKAAAWAASTATAQREQDARQMENANEADRFNAQRDADRAGFDAQLARVRQPPVRASGGSGADCAAPAFASAAPGMPATCVVPADLYWRAVGAARDLADLTDCLRGVSALCAADYNALTP